MLAWPCQGMLLMRWRWGVSSQIWSRASLISWTVWGVIWWHWMDQNVMSQQFSVGFKLGELGGHVSSVNSFILLHNLTAWNHCQTGHAEKCYRYNITFFTAFQDPFMSVRCARGELVLISEAHLTAKNVFFLSSKIKWFKIQKEIWFNLNLIKLSFSFPNWYKTLFQLQQMLVFPLWPWVSWAGKRKPGSSKEPL